MDITVTDAQLVGRVDGPNVWMLATEVTGEDGQTRWRAHVMPEDAPEWRSAEYGIDDPARLLEVLLYEPYLPHEDPEHPDSLINADTIEQAREHHLARIRRLRGTGQLRDRNRRLHEGRPTAPGMRLLADNDDVPETPLAQLRRELAPDPERVAVLREHVERSRGEIRQHLAGAATTAEAMRARPTAEQLRAQLAERTTTETTSTEEMTDA